MKVLITGVAGFIGSATAKKLVEDGHQVVGIDNFNDYYDVQVKRDRVEQLVPKDVIVVEGDILDKELLDTIATEHSLDVIIHLAAQAGVRYSLENPDAYIQTNTQGTNNMFELARKYKIPKVIYASSSSVYGGNTKYPFSEKDPVETPISLYAATKRANELQAHVYKHLFDITMIGLRFFTVYGPWGRPDMALYLFAEAIHANQPINVFNHGKMARGITYVDDIVQGVVACLDYEPEDKYDIINLSNDRVVPLMDYIKQLEVSMGKVAKKNYMDMQPGDVYKSHADISRARDVLGYDPKTNEAEGVKNFVTWFKEYKGIK